MREYCGPIARIQGTVASYYRLKYEDMFSATHDHYFSHPRQVAMYLARELTGRPLTEIGRRFRRDHSTVHHALKAVEKRASSSPELRSDLTKLRAKIEAQLA